jgi:hypothetical protein
MEEKKTSIHEKLVMLVIGAILFYFFIKIIFF